MKDFKGKVAVITGGANGIGFAIAEECAKREIKIVIADINELDLKKAEEKLKAQGAEVLALQTDVIKYEDMERLADKTLERFGHVDLLFNNAGVVVAGPAWSLSLRDWEWIMKVNVWGIIHGEKAFIPIMLKQDTECHIINTASAAGLLSLDGMSAYHTSKFAAVALSESTYLDLQCVTDKIKMSVFCPGFIQTDLNNCERHRPKDYDNDMEDEYYHSDSYKAKEEQKHKVIQNGIPVDMVGATIFEAIEEEKFYILTHPEINPLIGLRTRNILEGGNPSIKDIVGVK
ncbi:SDR family NAD(P)-dependent oxidoreductase [Clostridium cellulovorans]|uniref:Short-chain dehydrogenase/reductase SDR n=1 Tax=Clostridium cellulovorans (strain ATCC 35296 / DSM 3052 / OCM 3 / 743B) TaxID=573061 RepID=D9STE1_CLOC7|nr:SDR family NAD(P)-dependent oxidoreductase [Clostridium cellulovorans]ADL50757.1 short-chain dehydrogenase/reductase SDR [Clostridium cellulovorans 743B]